MSDEGEKICPLCAEEMDLTDQQLKPCKCGYEICVWCWHHIMEMAEKDETEGRCPACRSPYNKEKIVGTGANCERLVAGMNMEKKTKSQKVKGKTSEGRKQLSSVRVIQRNLVYVVGLPLNLADEDLLQRREYFGQYGKVLKVSISRTAAGAIQHFANSTCSVYITYSKEEEAVRCIQSVHGFVLDGRSLRACFGTTKYCHAWLRNVPCSNPDCLYLHETGSQEDSFTKDEIISAYTRSRVQQIAAATNNLQRRSGNVLPPPADEYYINSSASSGKPISNSSPSNSASSVRGGSPPNSSSGQSVTLPAAASWGSRASNGLPPANLVCSNGLLKQKPETCTGSMAFSTAVAGTTDVPILHGDVGKKLIVPCEEGRTIAPKGKQEPLVSVRKYLTTDSPGTASEVPVSTAVPTILTAKGQLSSLPVSEDKDKCVSVASNVNTSCDLSGCSYCCGPDKDPNSSADADIQDLCSDITSMNIDKRLPGENSEDTRSDSSLSDNTSANSPQKQEIRQCYPKQFREPLTSLAHGKAVLSTDEICVTREQLDQSSDCATREQSDWTSDCQTEVVNKDLQVAFPEVEEDLLFIDDRRLKDPEIVTRTSYLHNSSPSFPLSNDSRVCLQQIEPYGTNSFNLDSHILGKEVDKRPSLHPFGVPRIPNGCAEDIVRSSVDTDRTLEHTYMLPDEVKKHTCRFESGTLNAEQNAARDMGESSIISNILSMDFDPWEESLSSPQDFAKLLGETSRQQGSHKLSSSWKAQHSGQSRFSFARQEESRNKVSNFDQSLGSIGQVVDSASSLSHDFPENRDFNFDRLGNCNGFSTFGIEKSDHLPSSHSHMSSNKLSVSRSQISAPPGFGVPNRAPPPGFAGHERMEMTFDAMPGNHLLDASLRNPYQAPPSVNIASAGDLEFIDPAILAVGKGRLPDGVNNAASLDLRPNFPPQLTAFENEARLLSSMQRSFPPVQNQRFAELGDGFFSLTDAYRFPSRVMDQTLGSNLSPFSQLSLQQQSRAALMSNGQWDSWNEIQNSNDLGVADLVRTEILGYNKLYAGYEDSKFRMPSSGDLYNRTYGI